MRVIFIYFFYFYFFIFFFTRMSFSTAPIASTPVAAVAWRYSAVDNLSATFLLGGEGRASTPWLRVLRQGLLPQLRHVLELYIPSQHTTGARGLVADLQARCDILATEAIHRALPLSYPFPDLVAEAALLHLDGALVVDVAAALEEVYGSCVAPAAVALLPGPGWQTLVLHQPRLNMGIRWWYLLRCSSLTRSTAPHLSACPLCSYLVPDWGWHLLYECFVSGCQPIRSSRCAIRHFMNGNSVTGLNCQCPQGILSMVRSCVEASPSVPHLGGLTHHFCIKPTEAGTPLWHPCVFGLDSLRWWSTYGDMATAYGTRAPL